MNPTDPQPAWGDLGALGRMNLVGALYALFPGLAPAGGGSIDYTSATAPTFTTPTGQVVDGYGNVIGAAPGAAPVAGGGNKLLLLGLAAIVAVVLLRHH
jgi:hypothetical protein